MWETIEDDNTAKTSRMWVPLGWIVRTREWMHSGISVHMIFVSDEGHEWVLNAKR